MTVYDLLLIGMLIWYIGMFLLIIFGVYLIAHLFKKLKTNNGINLIRNKTLFK